MQKDKPLAMAPAQVALNNLSQLVKSNLVIVAVAVIVVVVLAAVYFTTESLQSPEAKLFSQIDLQVEEARRMLGGYNPLGQRFMAVIDGDPVTSSQPEAEFVATDQWPASVKTLEERLNTLDGEIEPLNVKFRAWKGTESSMEQPAANYGQLKQQLEADLKLVTDALNIIQAAVGESVEGADGTISGRDHPVATQLEAGLTYHKADLLRSKAAVLRDKAVAARQQFEELRAQWQMIRSQIVAIEAVAKGQAVSMPAMVDTRAIAPAEPSVSAAEPTKKPSGKGRPGAVSRLTGLLFGKKGRGAAPDAPAPAEPAKAVAEEQPKEPPAEAVKPSAPPVVIKPPTPEERLSDLSAQKTQAVADIAAAEADVTRLREHVSTLEKALASAQKIAGDSQLRMMRLEKEGVDPVAPGAMERSTAEYRMERFTAEYREASAEYRVALREATILEKGGIRNAKPGTDDEQELVKAPLVPADPGQPMKPSEGLISVRIQLKAAEDQLDAHKGVLASVDAQVAAVHRRQKDDSTRVAKLQESLASLTKQATETVEKAAAATAEAEGLTMDAIDLLTVRGKQAAQNAIAAAKKQIDDANNKRVPGVENARLELIGKGGSLVGHAQTLKADLALLTAYIQAERAGDLRQHSRVLQQAEAMGVGPTQPAEPAWASKSAAAVEEAAKARTQAIAEAKAAYGSYREAGSALNNLWVLNANAAAVCHLLSVLQTGEEANKSRDLAIQIYQQALQDRRDRSDAEQFRQAVDSLTKATQ